jgi:TPR repeat protein
MKSAVLFFLLCGSALADFAAGQQAMKNGDYVTALREFLPLAKDGNAAAQLYVGFLYENGAGVQRDYKEAAKWYRSTAEQGEADAQVYLGIKYENGEDGFPRDYQEAAKWYRLAAEQGDPRGQYFLGYLTLKGLGVAQDYVEAHMWLNLAGASGDERSIDARDLVANRMTPDQIAEAQRRAREWKPKAGR